MCVAQARAWGWGSHEPNTGTGGVKGRQGSRIHRYGMVGGRQQVTNNGSRQAHTQG